MPENTVCLCAFVSHALGFISGFTLSKQNGTFYSEDVKANEYLLAMGAEEGWRCCQLHVPGYRGITKSLRAGERHVCQILLAEQEYQRDLVYHTEML